MGRVSRDLGAGACLLGIAAVASWQGAGLELGTLRQMAFVRDVSSVMRVEGATE